MESRKLGNTGIVVSPLGLGMEHLLNASQEEMCAVIGFAIEHGINFFDVVYALPGWLERVGLAFGNRRDDVVLGIHLAWGKLGRQIGKIHDVKACAKLFEMTLRALRTDYVDVAFIHDVNDQREYESFALKMIPLLNSWKREGKTRAIGLSTHTASLASDVAKGGQIDVLMFPVHLANHTLPGRKELLGDCAGEGVGLVAMKPFEGGKLLGGRYATEPARCLCYALSQIAVSSTIPGVRNLVELEGVLGYLDATDEEKSYVAPLSSIRQQQQGECVYCNHCLPCPVAIDVGSTLRLLDRAEYRLTQEVQSDYDALAAKASACVECGDCTERCPFAVDVVRRMQRAVDVLEG